MSPKNIALLLGDIRDIYSNSVAKGAMKAAGENGCNLLESADKQMYKIKETHRAGRRKGDFIAQ